MQGHVLDFLALQNTVYKVLKPSCRRAVNGTYTRMDMRNQAKQSFIERL